MSVKVSTTRRPGGVLLAAHETKPLGGGFGFTVGARRCRGDPGPVFPDSASRHPGRKAGYAIKLLTHPTGLLGFTHFI